MKIRILLFLVLSISQLTIASTVDLPPTVSIVYINSPFCQAFPFMGNVTMTGTGAYTGGTFSSTPGLVINSSTGAIDIAASVPGAYIVTYTIPPMGGDPAVSVTTTVVINPSAIPTFVQIAPICQGSTPMAMPVVSANGITGTWSPGVINTLIVGITTFSFTPDPGQCAMNLTMNIIIEPLPTITAPSNFSTCDNTGSNNGYCTYPLDVLIPGILNGQNPATHTVTFHDAESDAQNNTNAIPNIASYQTYTQTIWIRVSNNASGCYSVSSFNTVIEQYATPVIETSNNNNVICVDYVTNTVVSNLTLNAINTTMYLNAPPIPNYTYQWYVDGVLISGAIGPMYSINTPLPGNTAAHYVVEMTSDSFLGCSSVSQAFSVFQSGQASPIGIGYSIVNSSGNQTLTVEVQGYGIYEYAIDNGLRQSSPVFSNVSLGTHAITVFDTEGGLANSCSPLMINNIDVNLTPTPPPTGDTTQTFSQGATLANVLVNGQNIQWFSGADKNTFSIPLPLSTVLVNGVTYFASQKIGGYVSTSRLPVLVQLALNNSAFELEEVTFYPNPVNDNLTIKNKQSIQNVSVYTILGQMVLSKDFNTSEVEIDVTSLNLGTYFVKVISDSEQKTFKIIKK
ncbi:MAG: T9SS type A sorting domain-containing protein [Bacteroidota bacterium]